MRSATQPLAACLHIPIPCGVRLHAECDRKFVQKYSLFIQIAFIFLDKLIYPQKNIIVVSRVSLFLSGANPSVFSCSLPIRTLQLNYNISQGLCQ